MQAGIYNALATVTDSKGAEASATYLVTVEPPPAV